MSPFQTMLFKINYTMTKLMDAILQNLQVWRASRKKKKTILKNMKIITLQK